MLIIETEDGLSCPKFACDVCGRVIEDVNMGMLYWMPSEQDAKGWTSAVVAHKRPCGTAHLEEFNSTMELEASIAYLVNYMGIDMEHAQSLT